MSLTLAVGAFRGDSAAPAGVNLFVVLFVFIAVIVWFDWGSIGEGYSFLSENGEHRRVHPMLVRMGPLLPLLLKPSAGRKANGK
ncbi:MAG: hypothetical protein ACREFA_05945 [Stellaceae bacterium]